MPAFAIIAPPLQDVRDAIWTRLTTDANTSGYTWMKEGETVQMPFLTLASAYLGEGGTDPELGVNVIIQIDAYAGAENGGSHKASEMISAVYAALSSASIEIDGFDPLTITVEADVLTPTLQDSATGALYAQRFARFRFLVTT